MEKNSNKNEDIDLGGLFNLIKLPFVALWNFIAYSFALAKKRWLILFIFTALGGGAGIWLFVTGKPVYASTLVLSSATLSNDFCADIIANLDILIRDNTPELLSKRLNIPINSARQLKGLEFDNYNENIKKKSAAKDTVVLGRPFKVKAYAANTTIFDTLQTALVNYLEGNEYALKRRELKKENYIQLREKLRENIRQIDSLKFSIALNMTRSTSSQTNIVITKTEKFPDQASTMNDPLSIFKEGMALYREELGINAALALSENIQVIQDFSPRAKPDSTWFKFMLKYGAAAFVLGMMLVYIADGLMNRKA